MKKTIACLLAVIMLFALSACQAQAIIHEDKIEPIKLSAFVETFKTLITETGEFEMAALERVEDSDILSYEGENSVLYSLNIMKDEEYYGFIMITCNIDNEVTGVGFLDSDYVSSTNIALISRYIYLSLGFSKMDVDEFCKAFAFYDEEKEEHYMKDESGWWLDVTYSDNYYFFNVIKSTDELIP